MRRGRGKGRKQSAFAQKTVETVKKKISLTREEEGHRSQWEMISKRKRRWKKKKILVIQMKAKKQENERKRKLSNGDNVDLKEEESVLGSNQARMVPRNRHLLGLDRMEAGGRVSRDELLKLLWNVWSLGKHDDGYPVCLYYPVCFCILTTLDIFLVFIWSIESMASISIPFSCVSYV